MVVLEILAALFAGVMQADAATLTDRIKTGLKATYGTADKANAALQIALGKPYGQTGIPYIDWFGLVFGVADFSDDIERHKYPDALNILTDLFDANFALQAIADEVTLSGIASVASAFALPFYYGVEWLTIQFDRAKLENQFAFVEYLRTPVSSGGCGCETEAIADRACTGVTYDSSHYIKAAQCGSNPDEARVSPDMANLDGADLLRLIGTYYDTHLDPVRRNAYNSQRQALIDSFKPILDSVPDDPGFFADIGIGIQNFFGNPLPKAKATAVGTSGASTLNPTTSYVAVNMTGAQEASYGAIIPAGSFSANRSGTKFTFKDRSGTIANGIVLAVITRQGDAFKVAISAVSGDLAALVNPTAAFVLDIGGATFSVTVPIDLPSSRVLRKMPRVSTTTSLPPLSTTSTTSTTSSTTTASSTVTSTLPLAGSGLIIFTREDSGGSRQELYTVNPDGTNEQTVANSGCIREEQATWSPDGLYIAFTCAMSPSAISIFNPSTAISDQLTHAGSSNDPAWSPDSTRIAFATAEPAIATIRTDGTDRVVIHSDGHIVGSPTWSPDGMVIAFYESQGYPYYSNVFLMNPDGSGVIQLTHDVNAYYNHLTWSPDGTKLAFVLGDLNTSTSIYVMDADGTHAHQLTNDPRYARYWGPSWSPDGTHIAYTGLSPVSGGGSDVLVMDSHGGNPTVIVHNQQGNYTWPGSLR